MLSARDSSARIRQLGGGHLLHLARYARSRMEQEIAEGQAEIGSELQVSLHSKYQCSNVSVMADRFRRHVLFAKYGISGWQRSRMREKDTRK